MPAAAPNDQLSPTEHKFETTHWSVVLTAAQSASPGAEAALETLCRSYWYPLYAYLRKTGHPKHEAEDLTQQFFASRVVTKRIFQGIQPGSGLFHSWLLTSLQNMVRNEWEKHKAAKRGGDQEHFSLDLQSAEGRYLAEPSDQMTPEKLFERACALELLNRAMDQLQEKYRLDGKADLFLELRAFLPGGESNQSHAEVATRLGKSEDAVKMAVSRLRKDYGRVLKTEVKRIAGSPGEVEAELQRVLAALRF